MCFSVGNMKKPSLATYSLRCWDGQLSFIKEAAEKSGTAQPELIIQAAVRAAAEILGRDVPEFPTIARRSSVPPASTDAALTEATRVLEQSFAALLRAEKAIAAARQQR
jgi:hypothetical protein